MTALMNICIEGRSTHSWICSHYPNLWRCIECGLVIEDPKNKNREEEESARANFEDMGVPRDHHNR